MMASNTVRMHMLIWLCEEPLWYRASDYLERYRRRLKIKHFLPGEFEFTYYVLTELSPREFGVAVEGEGPQVTKALVMPGEFHLVLEYQRGRSYPQLSDQDTQFLDEHRRPRRARDAGQGTRPAEPK